MLDFLTLQTSSANPTFITVIYSTALSFVLSSIIAFTYEKTYRGLSYSRNFVQAMVLGSIVAATVMQAIGDSLGRGLAMIGALAIIRFRTSFRDPKDIIFMFSALGTGISCGVYSYSAGAVGACVFSCVAFLLHYAPIGQTRLFDGLLKFKVETKASNKSNLEPILKLHCVHFVLVSLREVGQGDVLEYAYHIKLKKGKSDTGLLDSLKEIDSIHGINIMLQETTVEL